MTGGLEDLGGYLDRLRAIPVIRDVQVAPARPGERYQRASIAIKTARRTYRLPLVRRSGRLSPISVGLVGREPSLLLAPVIAGEAARRLAAGGVSYVDLVGNCHLTLGGELYVHVEGHRPVRAAPSDRGIRAAGFQVLFTYLVAPHLDLSLRAVGELAGASRQAALEMRARLLAEGYLQESIDGLQWNPRRRDDALTRWLEGYRATVRPRLVVGTYRTRTRDPDAVAAMLQSAAGEPGERWRWGGAAAGYQLRRHFRGERTVVHVRDGTDEFIRTLPVLRDTDGNLVILRSFGAVNWSDAFDGTTVHPLLVYSEMLIDGDDRAREAATDLFEHLLRGNR